VFTLHDDFHGHWVDPELLVPQSFFDIILRMAASEDMPDTRLSANGDGRSDCSWLVFELEIPAACAMQYMDDCGEESKDEKCRRKEVRHDIVYEYPLPECPDFDINRFVIRKEIDLLRNKCQVRAVDLVGQCAKSPVGEVSYISLRTLVCRLIYGSRKSQLGCILPTQNKLIGIREVELDPIVGESVKVGNIS